MASAPEGPCCNLLLFVYYRYLYTRVLQRVSCSAAQGTGRTTLFDHILGVSPLPALRVLGMPEIIVADKHRWHRYHLLG